MLARSSQDVKRVAARSIICCSFFRVLDSNFVWKWMGFCHLVCQWLSFYYLLLPLQFVKICFSLFLQVLGTGCLEDWKSVWILVVDHLFLSPQSSFISALWLNWLLCGITNSLVVYTTCRQSSNQRKVSSFKYFLSDWRQLGMLFTFKHDILHWCIGMCTYYVMNF